MQERVSRDAATGGIASFEPLDTSARVWARLLALKEYGAAPAAEAGWSAAERAAFDLYAALLVPAGTFVVAQVGQSLDGRVGTADGDCLDLSGADGLAHLHRLRALADVVVVGAATVVADDPRLTVRLAEGPDPARAALDPSGRVPPQARIWNAGKPRLAIQSVAAARPEGVETIMLERGEGGSIAPAAIVAALSARGFRRILVEGGARTIGSFLEARLVDRLHVSVTPAIIGSGPASFALRPVARLSEALRPETRICPLGSDLLFDCRFRR